MLETVMQAYLAMSLKVIISLLNENPLYRNYIGILLGACVPLLYKPSQKVVHKATPES